MNFNEALARKYQIEQQGADARSTEANASAALNTARAGTVPLEAQAQANLANANAQHATVESQLAPSLAQAQVGMYGAQARDSVSRAGLYGSMTQGNMLKLRPADPALLKAINMGFASAPPPAAGYPAAAPAPGGLGPGFGGSNVQYLGGANYYASGTAEVPGQGSGAVDQVPAVLAPHEAVLNAGAAAHLGPQLIDVLNAIGAHSMAMGGAAPQTPPEGGAGAPPSGTGMPTSAGAKGGKGKPKGFASGTANIGPGSDSYDSYVAGLQAQNPTSTPNVVAGMRAKLGGPDAPRPQPITPTR